MTARGRIFAVMAVGLGAALGPQPAPAHHSLTADYDDSKTAALKGVVTKWEWHNPHVYLFLDVTTGGRTVNWEVEYDATLDLKRVGWHRNMVRVGDVVSAEGVRARDGSNRISGRWITLADGRRMAAPPREPMKLAPPRSGPAKATPRWPDGHPRLGAEPGQRGYWADPSPGGLYDMTAGNIRMNWEGLLANIADAAKVAPFQPWAKALYEYRQRNFLKDDPMAFCLPPGGPRQFEDRYGILIIEQPERQRVIVYSGGGNRNWRIIPTDGRENPKPEEVTPTYYGYSTGKWEGDTFVVHSTAFAERFWFTNGGLPHTESLSLVERITRPDYNTLRYQVTVEDPATYTRPWTGVITLQWVPDADQEEYFCDDNNRETEHLSGKHETGAQ